MKKLESINNDETHLKNVVLLKYGKGLIVYDDRHMTNLALNECQIDLAKKMLDC